MPSGGMNVYLRGGEYLLDEPIILEQEDSGTLAAPITYRAYKNEKPVIVGGVKINTEHLKPITNADIKARIIDDNAKEKVMEVDLAELGITDLDEVNLPGAYSLPWIEKKPVAPELTINKKPMTLARYPNMEGDNDRFLTVGCVIDAGANPRYWQDDKKNDPNYVKESDKDKNNSFVIEYSDERISRWTKAEDIRLYGYWYWNWADQTVPVRGINAETHTIESAIPSWYSVRQGQKYYAYNLLEEIDVQGEYYIDRMDNKLYIYPPNEGIESMYLSMLKQDMFTLSASYVNIYGLDITATRGSAFKINGKNVTVHDCRISGTGETAAIVYGVNNSIDSCHIYDVNGGVNINGGDRINLISANNSVSNCKIERFSRITRAYNGAVTLGGVGNSAVSNEIFNAPHLAIQLYGNNHTIEYNDIHDVCKNADDMGAIYMGRSWVSRGNVFRYNYIHDLNSEAVSQSSGFGIYGVFLDDQFSGTMIFGNVFENIEEECKSAALFIASGKDNKFINNAVINARPMRMNDASMWDVNISRFAVDELATVPYRTELWKSAYPQLYSVLDGGLTQYRKPTGNSVYKNIFYNTKDMIFELADKTIVEIKNNTPNNKINIDPGFEDLENRNYEIKSCVDIDGFEAIPFEKMKKR